MVQGVGINFAKTNKQVSRNGSWFFFFLFLFHYQIIPQLLSITLHHSELLVPCGILKGCFVLFCDSFLRAYVHKV